MGLSRNEDEKQLDGTGTNEVQPKECDSTPTSTEGAKFAVNPNGDTKIEIEMPPSFSGLTKEELMKYANEPFWVRLRWALFILFWAGWIIMLVMAIVIIVQTPGCKPLPSMLWVEEQTAVQLDMNDLSSNDELLENADSINVRSVYIPGLISSIDFKSFSSASNQLIEKALSKMMRVVTDLPSFMDASNPLSSEASGSNLINADGSWNYGNEALSTFLNEEILSFWVKQGVTGFLIGDNGWNVELLKELLNNIAKNESNSFAVASGVVDTQYAFSSPPAIKSYLEEQAREMKFYQFNPNFAGSSSVSVEDVRLITMGMFLIPSTVILSGHVMSDRVQTLVKKLIEMKELPSIKFASTNFLNSTSGDVVAFTRVYKGTPAYAVALNFGDKEEVVDFSAIPYVADTGVSHIISQRDYEDFSSRNKYALNDVVLGPFEGLVLQFVANF